MTSIFQFFYSLETKYWSEHLQHDSDSSEPEVTRWERITDKTSNLYIDQANLANSCPLSPPGAEQH